MKTCLFRAHAIGVAYILALGFLLALGAPPSVSAQDTSFNPLGREVPLDTLEKQLRIQVEWFEIDHKDLTALLEPDDFSSPQNLNSSNNGPLREQMKEMVADDKAKLLETSIVLARSGQRAKTESIHEFIYPTEYDPGEIPTTVGDLGKNGKQGDAVPTTLPNATAFETRNVGATLEVDPVLGADDRTVDLNLAPELVYPVGELIYGEFESGKSKVTMKQPIFYSVRLTTQVTLLAGEYLFVGAVTPFDAESGMPNFERKILMFVKVDVLHTGLPLDMVKPKAAKADKSGGAKKQ